MAETITQPVETYPGPAVPLVWKLLVRLKLENPNINGKELAKVLGYNQQSIYLWQKRADFQAYENWVLRHEVPTSTSLVVEQTREATLRNVREKFETYTEEMQDRLLTIIRMTDNEKLQAELCLEFLDRAGVEKAQPEKRSTPILFTPEAVKEFFQRASEAGLVPQSLPTIDIEKAS